jgi:phosphopantetheinyl transferase (holo-ACP synthase)
MYHFQLKNKTSQSCIGCFASFECHLKAFDCSVNAKSQNVMAMTSNNQNAWILALDTQTMGVTKILLLTKYRKKTTETLQFYLKLTII